MCHMIKKKCKGNTKLKRNTLDLNEIVSYSNAYFTTTTTTFHSNASVLVRAVYSNRIKITANQYKTESN